MKAKTLTTHQLKLQEMGITLPPSPKTAQSLVQWIGRGGNEFDKRIAILKAAERDYVGKRVRHQGTGATGRVNYILHGNLSHRASVVRASGFGHRFTHPLDASVTWDSGDKHPTSIGGLEVIPDAVAV